ncbi:uncharacterized protein LOC114860548 isoform X2 [Betta splendens]|nr:uncharacterized protein LOC114860548 isoform X2 [Betta splendens]
MSTNVRKKKQRAQKPSKKKKREKVSTEQTNEAFGSNAPEFVAFLDQMIRWFSEHQQQVDQLFGPSDPDGSGRVHLKDFCLGLMNLDVPCQRAQLQTLTQLLKNAGNTIRYRGLNGQVQSVRLGVGSLEVGAQTAERGDVGRFVRLRLRLVPFDSSAAHPGNFEVILPSSTKVAGLTRIIQDRVGIQTRRLEVFPSRQTAAEACLPPERTLEECGFIGGPEESPAEDTVYYDYSLTLADCPLLNCDHYFRLEPDPAARRTRTC